MTIKVLEAYANFEIIAAYTYEMINTFRIPLPAYRGGTHIAWYGYGASRKAQWTTLGDRQLLLFGRGRNIRPAEYPLITQTFTSVCPTPPVVLLSLT
jgi:hypothetical protein